MCGRKIGVPWSASLMALPGLVVLPLCYSVTSPLAQLLIFAASVLVTGYLYWRYVPLVRRGPGLRGTLGWRDERRGDDRRTQDRPRSRH
jgi:hypothetical protein